MPDIDLFKKFLADELELVVKPTWNSIWEEATEENWLDLLCDRETELHEMRGTKWRHGLFREVAQRLGYEKIKEWECKFLLRFSALPVISLSRDFEIDWWKVKPRGWFYDHVQAGKIGHVVDGSFQSDREAFELHGEIVLIDTRLKPSYDGGRQMWGSDDLFCGALLRKLREERKIPQYKHGLQKSRFGVAADSDWQDHVRPALAELIGLEPGQVRLERAIEGNAISQLFTDLPRAQDRTTNTWVWYEEYFEDVAHRLRDGYAAEVGPGAVHCYYSGHRHDHLSFRPLGVLAKA